MKGMVGREKEGSGVRRKDVFVLLAKTQISLLQGEKFVFMFLLQS